MKKFRRQIYAGISGKLDESSGKYKFSVDFENNTDDDVIKFIEPFYHQSNIDENTYWFGYSFNDGQANPRRNEFIEYMKHVQPEKLIDPEDEWSGWEYDESHLNESDLNSMIHMSLNRLKLNNYSVDTIVYPESKSGNLVKMIVHSITGYIRQANKVTTEEIQKADPGDIEFDYERYYRALGDGKIDVPEYVDDDYIYHMMQRARNAKSFSMRKYIKPTVLRSYISNFYQFSHTVSAVNDADVILVVDDFGTTGTTIREIVRKIREMNTECEIYIFTLMGNRKAK